MGNLLFQNINNPVEETMSFAMDKFKSKNGASVSVNPIKGLINLNNNSGECVKGNKNDIGEQGAY